MTSGSAAFQTTAGRELRGRFLEGMSRAACTVNVVTTDGPAGRAGVTVSAMSSVSADGPAPRLLICVHACGSACAALLRNGVFCVNLLNAGQTAISDVFASRTEAAGGDRFAIADWVPMKTGAPRLANPLAAFDCRISQATLVGTHYVLFGAVDDVFFAEAGDPLIYANRGYRTSSRLPLAA